MKSQPNKSRIASYGQRILEAPVSQYYNQVTTISRVSKAQSNTDNIKNIDQFRRISTREQQSYNGSKIRGNSLDRQYQKLMNDISRTHQIRKIPLDQKIQQLRALKNNKNRHSYQEETNQSITENRRLSEFQDKKVQQRISKNEFTNIYPSQILNPQQIVSRHFGMRNKQMSQKNNQYHYVPKLYSQPFQTITQSRLKTPSKAQSQYSSVKDKTQKSFKNSITQQKIQQNYQKTMKSSKKKFDDQIKFLKPYVNKSEQIKKRLRKSFLAVFWLCSQVKQIKKKINDRKNKNNVLFNNVIQNVIQHFTHVSKKLLKPTIDKIKTFTNQLACKQNSKSYLIHLNEVQKQFLCIAPSLKKQLMADKHGKFILLLLATQRQHIPNSYLTQFQLNRIEMSRIFGYVVKTLSTTNILIITFIFIRLLILQLLIHPIKLGADLVDHPIWSKTINDLTMCIYFQCLEVIDNQIEQGEYFHSIGNWKSLKHDLSYKPMESFSIKNVKIDSKNLISHNLDHKTVQIFKQKLPNNWELYKDTIVEFCSDFSNQLNTIKSPNITSKQPSKSKHKK